MPNIKAFMPNKKNLPIWLLGGTAAIGLVLYERHKAATAVPVDTSATDTGVAGDTGSYDASQYDLSGSYGGYSSAGGYYSPSGYGYTGDYSGTPVSAAPTTDEQWSVAVVTALGNLGYDQTAVALAVGKYLLKQQLTQDQANMITAGLAQVGNPPQSGVIPIRILPSTGQTTTPTPLPKVKDGFYRN